MTRMTSIAMPFQWRHEHTEHGRQISSTIGIVDVVDVPVEVADPSDFVPLATPTGRDEDMIHGRDGMIYRPLLGPEGEVLDLAAMTAVLADPETDVRAWRDFPLHDPGRVYLHQMRQPTADEIRMRRVGTAAPMKRDDYAIRYGEDPRKGRSLEDLNRRRLGPSHYEEDRDAALARAAGMVLVGDVLMRPASLPVLLVRKAKDRLQVAVRSAEDRIVDMEVDRRRSDFAYDRISGEVMCVPASAAGLLMEVVEEACVSVEASPHLEAMAVFDVGDPHADVLEVIKEKAADKARAFCRIELSKFGSAAAIVAAAPVYGIAATCDRNPSDDLLAAFCRAVPSARFKDDDQTQLLAAAFLAASERVATAEDVMRDDVDAIEAVAGL